MEHISHFMWSKDVDVACALQYDDPSASADDVFFTNAKQDTPNPDFTANGQTGVWRTLSNDEWEYLLENNGSVWATINGINGLIIFCDGYSGSKAGLTEIPKDCLFLPVAGYRYGDSGSISIDGVVSYGCYWSSSTNTYRNAFDLCFFYSGFVSTTHIDYRHEAYSVRLVTDVTE